MDISVFLSSPSLEVLPENSDTRNLLAGHIRSYHSHESPLEGCQVAIVGVKEDRASKGNTGCASAPDLVRKYLYGYHHFDVPIKICDLGNIEAGNEISDTYFALNQVCREMLRRQVIPLIIGGSQDLTLANYQAYEPSGHTVNLVTIDQRLDFGDSGAEANSKGYLNQIILHKPNYLFNYSNLGHQRYLTDPTLIELMGKMYFDLFRLGEIQQALHLAEPIIRNADLVSFDISAIRMSEAPGCAHRSANGFYGEEAAMLARYAGLSDKLTSFGIYEYNPAFDKDEQTAQLVAQILWCFLEGYSQRKHDYPKSDYNQYLKYVVHMNSDHHELTFYKSTKSDRWWMDVPYPVQSAHAGENHHLVPCTYEEYLQATNEELPDRWWRTYQKLV